MTMTESSLEALREELLKAQDEARQARAELEESTKRVAELESQCSNVDTERIYALEEQIEELIEKLKKAEEASIYPLGSPKTQSDDEYIVVEQEQEPPESLSFQLKEREAEIRNALAYAKKLEEMYNAAEERTLTFERQVQVLEANMFEKFDDANALLEKVKELEELLTAGQIQIAALEEKSKSSDEAQKKVEYEKVLFLETEDQLVKNFKKAHDEAEQYRNMISQLETSVKNAEEKAAHAEKCMEVASERNQELESEIADLSFQLQRISRERSSYESNKLKSESELLELDKALAMVQDKAESLEQELPMYRGREKKVEDDVRSVDEKTVVHEATTSSHPVDPLQDEILVGESLDGHASSSIEDEMKFLGDNVLAHVTHSKLFMSQFEKLQSDHIEYAIEAESSKTQLKERVKDLEGKVSQLEEEILVSREREERMKQEAKVMEEKASFFEGLKLSYADYTCDLEKKNAKLEEELIIVREEVAAHTTEQQKWALDCDRMRNAEALVVDLQTQLEAPRVCEMCSQLKTQIQDLEIMLGELSLELQESKRREHDAQRDLKEKSASHEQLASEWMENAASQATEHSSRVQALDARVCELQEENLQAKASIAESRLWAQEAASLLREHAESLHELRGGGGCADVELLGKEEKEALQAKAEGLHLEFRDVQVCDGSEALQLCKQLLSLERDCLNFQMLDIAHKNSNLKSELEVLKSQIQSLQNPPESPVLEVKRSFREVTLDGEVQSLRAQLTELQHLRAQVSEIPSLQAQLGQLQLSLRAAEKRELEQNLELVKVQRKVSAAEEKVCSLKDTLQNQTQINELKEQVNLLEQNLMKSEANNTTLKEKIDHYVMSKVDLEEKTNDKATTDMASDNVTDEIVLEQASYSKKQPDITLQQQPKQKARKRKTRKNGKAPISQELIKAADRTHSSRHRIAVYFVSVVLVALVIRLSLR